MCCGLEVKTVGINQPLLLLIRQNYQNLIIITGIAVKIVKTKWCNVTTKWCSTTRKKPSENTGHMHGVRMEYVGFGMTGISPVDILGIAHMIRMTINVPVE